ncbi:hypothetical protein TNCV_2441801 [Trichonephila clavipes]|nr:hypothetical protein TNCV_2441801 [Trichonephila clavipes]
MVWTAFILKTVTVAIISASEHIILIGIVLEPLFDVIFIDFCTSRSGGGGSDLQGYGRGPRDDSGWPLYPRAASSSWAELEVFTLSKVAGEMTNDKT